MADKHRFNATVNLGSTSYAPGDAVPIGGKTGLPKDEVERLEKQFGKWQGKSASDDEKLARSTAENKELQATVAQLEKDKEILAARAKEFAEKNTALTSEKRDQEASLRQLEEDNEVLATRVANLEASLTQARDDNTDLAARVGELEKPGGASK
ncbi:hypothetical protein [Nitratireductor luteus]|uniref:hypothetical protein n=1 Tax=Nitratireductor luteus TaxID=2976980 RepID=UPI00223FDB89|nr:hypothetical protein [Nitratireductor luteus]